MKTVRLSVQEFAVPSPRRGDLEVSKGLSPQMQKGIEVHQQVQKKRKAQDPNYQAEKKTSQTFTVKGHRFIVEGRVDGIITGLVTKIEEIKSTSSLGELYETLKRDPFNHPYGLQLMTYGYFHWLETSSLPELSFHLVSIFDRKSIDLTLPLEIERYEEWLQGRLEELSSEAKRAEKRVARRKKLVGKLAFPFERPRSGQNELITTLEESLQEGKRLLLQAPTGLGKTVGVLYPNLREALARGQKVIYVTPKNSQQLVAEEAIEKIQEKGCKVRSLTLTAKTKICMKAEPVCDPAVCEYAKGYYDKLRDNNVLEQLSKKRRLNARSLKRLAEEHKVCPFELQLEAVADADAVICDYNHVLAERSSLGKNKSMDLTGVGKPNLVIDEAHNLPPRAMQHFSPSLSCEVLEELKISMTREGRSLINQCQELIRSYNRGKRAQVELDAGPFEAMTDVIREHVSRCLENGEDSNPALKFLFLWSEFCAVAPLVAEGRPEFFITHAPGPHGGALKITCCDASELIREKYKNFENVVAFSATIKPFEYYARLTGLSGEDLKTAEFISPFEAKKRKIILIPQISTKWSERERSYGRVAETISRVVSLRQGNYLAFFPSFDFMLKTLSLLDLPADFRLQHQVRNMKKSDVEATLSGLREGIPTLFCGVQGGMFSEGVDYPGDMVIGAFVVGPPLPNFDFEREKMKEYYQRTYKEGFDYAYAYPAMARAVQSAGRVIRSETDKGLIVLMDERFLGASYSKSMPLDWFAESPRELVSQGILKDIQEFWERE